MAVVICNMKEEPIFSAHSTDATIARAAELLAHAALDAIQTSLRSKPTCWLGPVDRMSDLYAFAYQAFGATFVVVHTERKDPQIESFCSQLDDLFTKALMNPLQRPGRPLFSTSFRDRVVALARSTYGADLH